MITLEPNTSDPGAPLRDLPALIQDARISHAGLLTVALSPGQYTGPLNLEASHASEAKPLSIVGGPDVTLTSSVEDAVITIRNASHLTLSGVQIVDGEEDGIRVDAGTHVTIQDVTIRGVRTGITVSGGDRAVLERCDHRIDSCTVTDSGEVAVAISGVGVSVTGSRLQGGGTGITVSGNEHTVQNNRIHDLDRAIRMGGDWTERGTLIRHNRIHHTKVAIDLDDFASGAVMQSNVFHDTAGVRVAGGRNHRITNNIFAECLPAIEVDARGMDESETTKARLTELRESFDRMNPLDPPYSIRYPDLKEVAAYYHHVLGIPPEGNLINRNICVGDWVSVHEPGEPRILAIQGNFTDGDPGFADLSSRDLRLPEDAEVYELGFRPLPADILKRN